MKSLANACRVALVGGLLGLSSCASSGTPLLSYSSRRVPDGAWQDLFEAARTALVAQGYAIDQADPLLGVMISSPVPVADRTEGRLARRHLGTPAPFRRVARIRLARAGEGINVYCQVSVQEQVTESHRFLRHTLGSTHLPSETPIMQGGATTSEQNTVWRTVNRNMLQERAILKAILAASAAHETP